MMRMMMNSWKQIGSMLVVAVVGVGAVELVAQQTQGTPSGRMLRPKTLIHVVANLEKSIAFFREGMNLGAPSAAAPFVASALVQKAVSPNPSATARAATLAIPGSNLELQLIQFSGIE